MKTTPKLFATLLAVACPAFAYAAPQGGIGVDVGLASSTMTASMTNGTSASYQGTGLNYGLDFQIPVSEKISINPMLMFSSEASNGAIKSATHISHDMFGFQFRYWSDNIFTGAHIGSYSEVLTSSSTTNNTTTSVSTYGNGLGYGLVAGWEPTDRNWFFMVQLDSAKIKYTDADVNMADMRMSVGYRWK